MDIIEKFREFAKEIQEVEDVKIYNEKQNEVEKSTKLQQKIEVFNRKKADMNFELAKSERDEEKIKEINLEMKNLYDSIFENNKMKEFNLAKEKIDELVKNLNYILVETINGADPQKIKLNQFENCGGQCGSCGGCH